MHVYNRWQFGTKWRLVAIIVYCIVDISRDMTKPTNWVCAQRRLRSAWASAESDQSSLCAQWVAMDPSFLHADSEDSDQTGRMPMLIWVFAGRTLTLMVLSCRGSYINFPLIVFTFSQHSLTLWLPARCTGSKYLFSNILYSVFDPPRPSSHGFVLNSFVCVHASIVHGSISCSTVSVMSNEANVFRDCIPRIKEELWQWGLYLHRSSSFVLLPGTKSNQCAQIITNNSSNKTNY